jgi:prepilin-type N-terminal cleavage/methylation domain-containing protein
MRTQQKGFTLIELLVVIAIVAVLAVVVLLTLNPAELLRQARDSNRINDMNTLETAIGFYLADVSTPSMGAFANCYAHASSGIAATAGCGGRFTAGVVTTSSGRSVDGTGWLPINFSAISAGAPLSQLPVDPVNNATYFYAFRASSTLVYEMNANMESVKYSTGGSSDAESTDGGNSSTILEAGTVAGLSF